MACDAFRIKRDPVIRRYAGKMFSSRHQEGEVEQGKFVSDNGQEHTFANNAKSEELMSKHMCHEVEVRGTVIQVNGTDTIRVSSFKHLAEGKC